MRIELTYQGFADPDLTNRTLRLIIYTDKDKTVSVINSTSSFFILLDKISCANLALSLMVSIFSFFICSPTRIQTQTITFVVLRAIQLHHRTIVGT